MPIRWGLIIADFRDRRHGTMEIRIQVLADHPCETLGLTRFHPETLNGLPAGVCPKGWPSLC